ncbi:MAG: biotin--[acetyl-CoA-carboxylase] ligase [Verrucomicrobia bacterium]|nr:biotin--[acetyl-CoA-carboxylase] ligase [Cytophagales bacterium]
MYNISPNTLFTGKKIVFLPTCQSTNDVAAELIAKNDFFEGLVVITARQTAGRGQRGNTWEADSGKNLTFSMILSPSFLPVSQQFQLNVAISLAVHDFLGHLLPQNNLKIKWSNDLFYKDKKLGGILIENTVKSYALSSSVIGIGLNINQEDFAESRAVSVKNILQQDTDLENALKLLLELLEKYYLNLKNKQYMPLKNQYLQNLYWFEEWHFFKTTTEMIFEGKITGIDELGRLAIETRQEKKYFNFKEIVFLHES